jgi:hypothetical protein
LGGYGGADGEGVDVDADGVFDVWLVGGSSAGGGAEDDVGVSAVGGEEEGPGSLDDGVDGEFFLLGECADGVCLGVVQGCFDALV